MNESIIAAYHEIDFLLPAQRFNIQYSYVTQRGLPFIREFVLRLVHVAPMTKLHIMTYFGLTERETNHAISDLIDRDELQLNSHDRLILTAKSQDYFNEMGASPQVSEVFDSGATLTFELASFSCVGNGNGQVQEKWKNGIQLHVDKTMLSQSEILAEKQFHKSFHEILNNGYLAKAVSDGSDNPSIYTVNAVNKLREVPIRLTTEFSIDIDGLPVERSDIEVLNDSEAVHSLITSELSKLSKQNNIKSIAKAMSSLEDEETIKLINASSVDLTSVLQKIIQEQYENNIRRTILGPIYSEANWDRFTEILSPILNARMKNKSSDGTERLIWIVPSDPCWGKSIRCASSVSHIISQVKTKHKSLFTPTIFVPMSDRDDRRMRAYWSKELDVARKNLHGLREGFLAGDVEILYFENELIVVIYHFSIPENLPVSLPLGFMSTDKNTIKKIGHLVKDYVDGSTAFDMPNDFGAL